LPLASKRLETTGEEIPPIVTGGIKDKRTGLGIVEQIRKRILRAANNRINSRTDTARDVHTIWNMRARKVHGKKIGIENSIRH
jgi:hypothetical protein